MSPNILGLFYNPSQNDITSKILGDMSPLSHRDRRPWYLSMDIGRKFVTLIERLECRWMRQNRDDPCTSYVNLVGF